MRPLVHVGKFNEGCPNNPCFYPAVTRHNLSLIIDQIWFTIIVIKHSHSESALYLNARLFAKLCVLMISFRDGFILDGFTILFLTIFYPF